MPNPRRPRDPNQCAKLIVDIATGTAAAWFSIFRLNALVSALHFQFYNFARPHTSLKNPYPRTPAMAAEVDDHVWSLREIAALLD